MPTVINDSLVDILPLVLKSKVSDSRCYLCTRLLDKPRKVAKLPPQYQICCACRKMLKSFAKNQMDYFSVIEVIERTIEKTILLQGTFRRKFFSTLEMMVLTLFSHTPFGEKEKVKIKLTWFFRSRQ